MSFGFFNKGNLSFGKISYYLLQLLLFVLPLNRRFVPPIIVIWALFTVITIFKEKIKPRKSFILFGLILLYILYAFSWLWSANKPAADFDLQEKLSLLIFPLLFLFIRYDKKQIRQLLLSFIQGCLAAVVLCFSIASYKYFLTQDTGMFFYANISPEIHTSYMAMLICLAALIIGLDFIYKKYNLFYNNYLRIAIILFFTLFIYFLSSKTGIITIVLLLALLFVLWSIKNKKILISLGFFVVVVGSFFLVFKHFPSLEGRFASMINVISKDESGKTANFNSTQARVEIWKVAVNLIEKKPIIGYGNGDVNDVLKNTYRENFMGKAYAEGLNAHNQYFETSLAVGLIGLAILLFIFALSIFRAFKINDFYSLGLVLIIMINLCTEAMLERQTGVVFIALMICLFVSHSSFLSLKEADNSQKPEIN